MSETETLRLEARDRDRDLQKQVSRRSRDRDLVSRPTSLYSISITGKMTGKSYAPTEMIIRGLPGWLAWFAGGWGDPIPPGKYWRPASAAAGFDIYTPQGPAWEASRVGQGASWPVGCRLTRKPFLALSLWTPHTHTPRLHIHNTHIYSYTPYLQQCRPIYYLMSTQTDNPSLPCLASACSRPTEAMAYRHSIKSYRHSIKSSQHLMA